MRAGDGTGKRGMAHFESSVDNPLRCHLPPNAALNLHGVTPDLRRGPERDDLLLSRSEAGKRLCEWRVGRKNSAP